MEGVGGRASGSTPPPWNVVAVGEAAMKRRIRLAAEAEEQSFYAGKAGEEWLRDLAPLGTDADKPFLEVAPWLVVVFAERYRIGPDRRIGKNYYIGESVGIATGMLLTALHCAGRSEEHTSELQSLMRISYAVFCLKKKTLMHSYHTCRHMCEKTN